ncbi:Uncharacterised protein [Vibrio cholerae]|uniref:Uncharacterized protein n=1 Tax=Vibrio cholerae TaxID=666 RepID=A0A655RZN2_VIBCL|nr:Uncharacterised protein [Vibrio cholerae]CSB51672.1 Uncharacterised protein [Vibrio cholerae]CSB78661.1 Uncharacterised protein [Vibrio cholerae]CSB91778.1 Uncharacterised protein [Vibrio cholerae]
MPSPSPPLPINLRQSVCVLVLISLCQTKGWNEGVAIVNTIRLKRTRFVIFSHNLSQTRINLLCYKVLNDKLLAYAKLFALTQRDLPSKITYN